MANSLIQSSFDRLVEITTGVRSYAFNETYPTPDSKIEVYKKAKETLEKHMQLFNGACQKYPGKSIYQMRKLVIYDSVKEVLETTNSISACAKVRTDMINSFRYLNVILCDESRAEKLVETLQQLANYISDVILSLDTSNKVTYKDQEWVITEDEERKHVLECIRFLEKMDESTK